MYPEASRDPHTGQRIDPGPRPATFAPSSQAGLASFAHLAVPTSPASSPDRAGDPELVRTVDETCGGER